MRMEPILPKGKMFNYDKMHSGLVRAMSDTVKDGQRQMQDYPPQQPSLYPYRRTGTLRRSWSSGVEQSGSNITGIVGSNAGIAPYNRLVQGIDQMPIFDAYGWPDVRDLKEEVQRQLPPRLRRAIKSAVGTGT